MTPQEKTKMLCREVQKALRGFLKACGKFFLRFEIIGTAQLDSSPSDIDLLIVISDKESPSQALEHLAGFFKHIRHLHQFTVSSDSLFLPFFHATNMHQTAIVHLILFFSPKHFYSDPFSLIVANGNPNPSVTGMTVQEASEVIALSDALRCWCIHTLNGLESIHKRFLKELQKRSVARLISRGSFSSKNIEEIVSFLNR